MKIIWFLWGLPQNLIGGIMYLMFSWKAIKIEKYKDSVIVFLPGNVGAVSLGMFIFFFANFGSRTEYIKRHEYGHSIQSKILGPLYLLVIGVPSIIWASFFAEYRRRNKISYYDFYPEKWANKLGGN